MLFRLLLAFTLIPTAEIYLLIKIGGQIGALNTIFLIFLTAIVGAYLAKMEGLRTLTQIQSSLAQGIMPTEEMVDALLIFVAGLVLLTPGFITDCLGLLILFPPSRRLFKAWLKSKFQTRQDWIDIHKI